METAKTVSHCLSVCKRHTFKLLYGCGWMTFSVTVLIGKQTEYPFVLLCTFIYIDCAGKVCFLIKNIPNCLLLRVSFTWQKIKSSFFIDNPSWTTNLYFLENPMYLTLFWLHLIITVLIYTGFLHGYPQQRFFSKRMFTSKHPLIDIIVGQKVW